MGWGVGLGWEAPGAVGVRQTTTDNNKKGSTAPKYGVIYVYIYIYMYMVSPL